MVHKNRCLGSDQRFSSHSNLFSCLSPPAKRKLCYPTPPSTIHDSKKSNKLVGKVFITLNSPAQHPSNDIALTTTTMDTHNCSPLSSDEAGVKNFVGYSCPNAPSLSTVWLAHHLKI